MNRKQIIPLAVLGATLAMTAYMVVRLAAQPAPAVDFSNAAAAEVHDAQGQVILRGHFAPAREEGDDVERKAQLEAAGADSDAAGEAEIEFAKDAPAEQEIEFSVQNLQPASVITFVIDGHTIGQATVDQRGRAEVEIDVANPPRP